MGRKKRRTQDGQESRTWHKRHAQDLKDLGGRLLELPPDVLHSLHIPETLLQAVLEAKTIRSHEGRRRQLQYIGKLMRRTDTEPIRLHFQRQDALTQQETADFKTVEQWRDELIAGSREVLDDIRDRLPRADLEHIQALAEQAAREHENTSPPHASRALFRYLRERLEEKRAGGGTNQE